jgi:hypothetical protein
VTVVCLIDGAEKAFTVYSYLWLWCSERLLRVACELTYECMQSTYVWTLDGAMAEGWVTAFRAVPCTSRLGVTLQCVAGAALMAGNSSHDANSEADELLLMEEGDDVACFAAGCNIRAVVIQEGMDELWTVMVSAFSLGPCRGVIM